MNTVFKFSKRRIVILILALVSAVAFIGFTKTFSAKALNGVETSLFMPVTELEFDNSLNAPQDVYCGEGVTAVIQNNNQLLISKNGGAFTASTATFTSLQQVKRLDQNNLLVSDEAKIYKIDLTAEGYPKEVLNYETENVTCNLFDFKDGILVGNYSNNTLLYRIVNGVATEKSTMSGVLATSPVCINDGFVYYVNTSSKLCKRSTDLAQTEIELANVVPQKMVTDGVVIYALCADGIYKIDIENKSSTKLTVLDEGLYDLGSFTTASGLCFRGGNLLISDSAKNTLQEFKVVGDNLEFTGYAVASEKTAYNRIGKSAEEIEFNAGRIAVLNNQKKTFTVVSDIEGSLYEKDNFALNLIFGSDPFIPDTFALGESSALFVNKTQKTAKLYDFSTATLSSVISFAEDATDSQITDVTWQNGKYYLSQRKWDDPHFKLLVYTAEELSNDFSKIIDTTINSVNYPLITVDAFENVYATSEYNNCIFKYSKTNGEYGAGVSISLSPTGIKKITTDLAGGLFALTESSVIYYDQAEDIAHTFDISAGKKANSFAISFESNKVFFVYEDLEYCEYSTTLPVLSLDEISVPADFVIDGENGIALDDLKIFGVKEGANVYGLNKGENKFDYKGLIDETGLSGAFVCDYAYSKNFTSDKGSGLREESFILFVGKDAFGFTEIYLANRLDAVELQKQTFTVDTDTAYTTTGVRMYFMPIITQDALFTIKANEQTLALNKGVKLTVSGGVEFLGSSFYYATVTVDGATYSGYIPVKFTAKVLSKNYPEITFTVKKVSATAVYAEKELVNLLTNLADGTEVRVLEENESFAKIAYQVNGEYIVGFISVNSFAPVSNNVLRNVLIILAITVSVCVTSLFLVLRKKS